MSKRGLSLQEKRQRLEQHFHETGEFYQLKELEKIGPKKGIVAQSVKDVVQSLVDDGLVTVDRIANSNYFWSFPSTAAKARRDKLQSLRENVQKERERVKALQEAIQAAQAGREPSEFRDKVLEKLKQAQQEQRQLLQELQRFKDNDPATYREKEKGIIVAKDAANRWTENIWALESYCVNKFGMDRRDFEKAFGVPDDFDTLP